MEIITEIIIENANYAHWIIFFLLILAGFNLPISEDLLLIIGGMLASTVIPENTYLIFFWTFAGCYFSDWIAYGLGRTLGPRLWELKPFAHLRRKKYLESISNFYDRYGFFTLLVGRFIPFGVRNCLFITAGMSKMHFGRFIISDGIACFTSNAAMFYLAYSLGKNYVLLLDYLRVYHLSVFAIAAVLVASLAFYLFRKSKS